MHTAGADLAARANERLLGEGYGGGAPRVSVIFGYGIRVGGTDTALTNTVVRS